MQLSPGWKLSTSLVAAALLLQTTARADAPPDNSATAIDVAQQAADAAGKAADAASAAAAAAKAAAEAAKKIAQTSSAPAPAAAAAPAKSDQPAQKPAEPPPPPKSLWDGTFSFDLISLTGNASSLTGSVSADITRKSEDWIFEFLANGKYGQSRATVSAPTQILAEQAAVQLRVDRRFTPRYAGYLQAGEDMDHVKSIRDRSFGEAGVSVLWVDEKDKDNDKKDFQKQLFRTDLALRGSYEDRFQFFPEFAPIPSVMLVAPRFGVSYRYALTKDVIFQEDIELITNVYGDARVLVNNMTKIAARLTASLAVTAGFEAHYDSAPAPGRVNTDTALTLGLQLAL